MSVRFATVDVDGLKVFYRSAGDPSAPAVLLLHGFPSASHMFRDLIPELAGHYHVVAPDLPGFGMTEQPARDAFSYSFGNIASVITRFTETLGLGKFAVYVFDYGAPVGFRLAMKHPDRITAIVTQNGNTYLEGVSEALRTHSDLLARADAGQPRRSAPASWRRRPRCSNTRTAVSDPALVSPDGPQPR